MKSIIIEQNDAEQRLDKFLKKLFVNASMSLIYKLNRKWNIKINKKKKPNDYKLQVGEEMKIFVPDDEYKKLTKSQKTREVQSQSLSKNDIIFEDKHIIAINKEAWVLVHPWDFQSSDVSLIYQVQDYLWKWANSLTFSPALVHRIDKDTSGIILIAKQKQALSALVSDFKMHTNICKTYTALVFWKLSRHSGTIQKKLVRLEKAHNQNKIQVSDSWQTAISHYTLKKQYFFDTWRERIAVSEVEVTIDTGRMHQIRVHMAHIWNPIVWDSTYGDKFLNSYVSKTFWVQRQFLHARKLEFQHPVTHKKKELIAPLKQDMQSFMQKLSR